MALSNSDNKNYSIKHTPKTTVLSIHLTRFVCLHTVCSDTGTHVNTVYFVVSRGVIFLEFLFWIISRLIVSIHANCDSILWLNSLYISTFIDITTTLNSSVVMVKSVEQTFILLDFLLVLNKYKTVLINVL